MVTIYRKKSKKRKKNLYGNKIEYWIVKVKESQPWKYGSVLLLYIRRAVSVCMFLAYERNSTRSSNVQRRWYSSKWEFNNSLPQQAKQNLREETAWRYNTQIEFKRQIKSLLLNYMERNHKNKQCFFFILRYSMCRQLYMFLTKDTSNFHLIYFSNKWNQ